MQSEFAFYFVCRDRRGISHTVCVSRHGLRMQKRQQAALPTFWRDGELYTPHDVGYDGESGELSYSEDDDMHRCRHVQSQRNQSAVQILRYVWRCAHCTCYLLLMLITVGTFETYGAKALIKCRVDPNCANALETGSTAFARARSDVPVDDLRQKGMGRFHQFIEPARNASGVGAPDAATSDSAHTQHNNEWPTPTPSTQGSRAVTRHSDVLTGTVDSSSSSLERRASPEQGTSGTSEHRWRPLDPDSLVASPPLTPPLRFRPPSNGDVFLSQLARPPPPLPLPASSSHSPADSSLGAMHLAAPSTVPVSSIPSVSSASSKMAVRPQCVSYGSKCGGKGWVGPTLCCATAGGSLPRCYQKNAFHWGCRIACPGLTDWACAAEPMTAPVPASPGSSPAPPFPPYLFAFLTPALKARVEEIHRSATRHASRDAPRVTPPAPRAAPPGNSVEAWVETSVSADTPLPGAPAAAFVHSTSTFLSAWPATLYSSPPPPLLTLGAVAAPPPPSKSPAAGNPATCSSSLPNDVPHAQCQSFCRPLAAKSHCRWCKCRRCSYCRSLDAGRSDS